jgi:hypothetical protein
MTEPSCGGGSVRQICPGGACGAHELLPFCRMNAIAPTVSELRNESRYFYLWMGAGFLIVAFGGFIPTYWSKVATGTFHGPTILHVHGMLLFSWVCFYVIQTALVAAGRTVSHRHWGLAGISLFTFVLCSVLAGQIAVIKAAESQGFGDAARRFSAVALCALPLLAGFFALAIANSRRSQIHKRWMVLLMSAMMTPAIARVFLTLFAPPGADSAPPPPFVSIPPALVADLFIVVAIVRDWRTLGKPHAIYMYGGLILLAQQLLTPLIAATAPWMQIATAFERLAV